MKKFMTSIKTLAALLMAGAAFSACSSSDDNIANEQPANPTQPQVYTMVIKASKGGDATTRALQGGGGSVTAYWNGNEAIDVVQGDGTTKEKIGTASAAESSDGSTTITATLTSEPTGNLYFVLGGTTWSYTGQNGILAAHESLHLVNISKDYDFAVAELAAGDYTKNGAVITPEIGATLNFVSRQAIVKFILKDKANDAINPSSLTIHVSNNNLYQSYNLLTDEATYGDITINPANTTNEIFASLCGVGSGTTVTLTATVGADTYTYEKSNVTFTHDKYYEITVKMTKLPEGAINGKFSVSETKQVYFSKGNLQYQASTGTWRFAEHQYDYVGNAAGNNTSSGRETQSGWIDLFGWGTSGKTFASGYGTAYQPWTTSTTNTEYGPTDGTSGLTGDYANGDWGVNMGTGWRTLTSGEWSYLFNTRTTGGTVFGTAQARYTEATINTDGTGVNGIILFPDGVDIASGEVTTAGTVNSGSAWATKCTTAQWAALESKGCVFLPAAGYRNGTSVVLVGSYGFYWSSTPNGTNGAYGLYFYSGSVNPAGSYNRCIGFSVRLVQ